MNTHWVFVIDTTLIPEFSQFWGNNKPLERETMSDDELGMQEALDFGPTPEFTVAMVEIAAKILLQMPDDDHQRDGRMMQFMIAELADSGQFKAYVHNRLDVMGVVRHPNGKHTEKGCRVGDRLDLMEAALNMNRKYAADLENEKRSTRELYIKTNDLLRVRDEELARVNLKVKLLIEVIAGRGVK